MRQTLTRAGVVLVVLSLLLITPIRLCESADFEDALRKSILFFEQQRSGKLPPNQRAKWRGDSGLKDGKDVGVDLTKGYYDSGDNVKYGLPMAFTITTLAWSVVEYSSTLTAQGQLNHALDAIRWGTDFFISAHPQPNVLYAQVGDGPSDHRCWQRPEDMTTPRMAFRLDAKNPGTEVAAEAAAALAAASMAFESRDKAYSALLLRHAKELFTFANSYRKSYVSSIPSAAAFYNSYSGFNDELLWAAAWLHRATGEAQYLTFVKRNNVTLQGVTTSMNAFSWDNKFAGAQILLAKVFMKTRDPVLEGYQLRANDFVCNIVVRGTRTPGGLLFVQPWSNLQYVAAVSLLLAVYSDYLDQRRVPSVKCDSTAVTPAAMRRFVAKQMRYMLGENPKRMSYMVGYGSSFPVRVHHRGASIVSIRKDPRPVACEDGFKWFHTQSPNANVLVGAVVGGPDNADAYKDVRDNYQQSEVSTYVNSPLVGALARLVAAGDASLPPTKSPTKPPGGGGSGGSGGKGGDNKTGDGGSGKKGGSGSGDKDDKGGGKGGSGSGSGGKGGSGKGNKSGNGTKSGGDGKNKGEGSGDKGGMKYRNGSRNSSSGSTRTDSNKTGSKSSGSNKSGSKNSGSNKSGSNKTGSNNSRSSKPAEVGFKLADSRGSQGPSTTFIASVRDAQGSTHDAMNSIALIPLPHSTHDTANDDAGLDDNNVVLQQPGGISSTAAAAAAFAEAAGGEETAAQLSVTTVVTAQWEDVEGRSMAQYMVLLRNDGTSLLPHIRLAARGFHPTSTWGLVRVGDLYSITEGRGVLAPGQSSRFGYVQEGAAAAFYKALEEEV